MNSLDNLKNLNNGAVDWLMERLKQSNYRGQHLVQHYRYNFDNIYDILKLLNKYAPHKQLLPIRTKDLSKQPLDSPEWRDCTLLCNEVKNILGKNSWDVLRKIIFVDLERLGFIHRYNRKKKVNKLYTKNTNAFVSLSDYGLDLLKCNDVLKRQFLLGKHIDIFLNNCIENLLYILRETDFKYIDIYEYMFFMTAIDFESNFELTKNKAIEYIKEYRNLSKAQQQILIKELQTTMITKNGDIKGFDRKDFHNWKNETQSLFDNFLKNTIYFQLQEEKILLSEETGLFSGKRLDRSIEEKQNYFNNHKISKQDGFELHHIIPLAYSTSLEHFKLLDRWQNLIYIDAYSHRKIKQHIILESANSNDLKLTDYNKKEIYLKDKDNVLYGYNQKQIMLDKNKELRDIK